MFRHYALYFVKTSRLLHIALVLLTGGGILSVMATVHYNGLNWQPLNLTLPTTLPPTKQTFTLDVPFRIDLEYTEYHVTLAVDAGQTPALSAREQDWLNAIQYQFTYKGQKLDFQDSIAAEFSGTGGQFRCKGVGVYTLHVTGRAAPPAMQRRHPRLLVSTPSEKSASLRLLGLQIVASAMALAGLIYLFKGMSAARRFYLDARPTPSANEA